MTLAVLAAGMDCAAQTGTATPAQSNFVASADPPPAPASASDTGSAQTSSVSASPAAQPTVDQKIDMLMNRIEQLENEVKLARAAALADSNDTAAMKEAEKEMLAGNGAGGASAQATPPPPAAAPAICRRSSSPSVGRPAIAIQTRPTGPATAASRLPGGGNGSSTEYACANGSPSGYGYEYTIPFGNTMAGLPYAEAACYAGGNGTGVNTSAIWWPDLRTNQSVATMAIMVRF